MDAAQAQLWKADLKFLDEQIRAQHANPYHQVGRVQLDTAVEALRERIPQLARHQVIVEMARVLTLVGDGHSSFWMEFNKTLKFHKYPLRFYEFNDGVFVYEVEAGHRQYLGLRLVAVGKYPVEEALRLVASAVPRDNEMGVKLGAPHLLSIPEVLHTFGIIDTLESGEFACEFILEDAYGERLTVRPPLLEPQDS